jgi:hypothetical protein
MSCKCRFHFRAGSTAGDDQPLLDHLGEFLRVFSPVAVADLPLIVIVG